MINPITLWCILRILTSLFAGFISSLKPITSIEFTIPFLPPSTPIIHWLNRAMVSPWMRWDALWYQKITTQGYSATDGTAQFHPLYPLLATLLTKIGLSPAISLLIISSLAGFALFYFFRKLARLDLSLVDASFALMLFAFSPPSFILFAPYSESLFLLLSILFMIFTRQKYWWLAGLMGGLAALTRQQGIFLLLPMAWMLWDDADREPRNVLKQWRDWLSLLLIPIGMFIWLIYRAFFLNDVHTNFHNFQDFIYSFTISPSATKVVPMQQFIWPWQALYHAIQKIITQPDWDIGSNLVVGIIFLVILAFSWKKLSVGNKLYSLTIALVSFSYYTGPTHPYMGLPRHLFLAFPIFIGIAPVIKKPWLRLLLVGISGVGMSFLLCLYVLNVWIP